MLIRKSKYTSGRRKKGHADRSRAHRYLIALFLILAAVVLIGVGFWDSSPPPLQEPAPQAETAH